MTGLEFRAKRKAMRLTQAQIAEMMGCSRHLIIQIENGVEAPAVYALAISAIEASHEPA